MSSPRRGGGGGIDEDEKGASKPDDPSRPTSTSSKSRKVHFADELLIDSLVATDIARQDQKAKLKHQEETTSTMKARKAPPRMASLASLGSDGPMLATAISKQKTRRASIHTSTTSLNSGPTLASAFPKRRTMETGSTFWKETPMAQNGSFQPGGAHHPRRNSLDSWFKTTQSNEVVALAPSLAPAVPKARHLKKPPPKNAVASVPKAPPNQVTPPPQIKKPYDDMLETKLRERQITMANRFARKPSLPDQKHQSRPSPVAAPSMPRDSQANGVVVTPESNRPVVNGESSPNTNHPHRTTTTTTVDESTDDDSAYALAMARSNMQQQSEKEVVAAGRRYSMSAVPPLRRPSYMGTTDEPRRISLPAPVTPNLPTTTAVPGAFAVQGLDRDDSDSDSTATPVSATYESDVEEAHVEVSHSSALEAEVYEQVVVQGDIVHHDVVLDGKQIRRMRFVQVSLLCVILGAIGVVAALSVSWRERKPSVQSDLKGWAPVGGGMVELPVASHALLGADIALSRDGGLLVTTAPGMRNGDAVNVGEIHIMEATETINGTQFRTIHTIQGPSQSAQADLSLSISQNAEYIAVGYPRLSDGACVHVYKQQGDEWVIEDLVVSSTDSQSWFGYSVDISDDGTVLAVGAPLGDGPFGSNTGQVEIFQRSDQGEWTAMGLEILGNNPNEYFGWSVSLKARDGLRVAIGGPVGQSSAGVARVYDWDGRSWVSGRDFVGESPLRRFGESVSLSNDGGVLAIGAPGTVSEPGEAHIYHFTNNQWVKDSSTIAGAQRGEEFGYSVYLSGDGKVLAVGAPTSDTFGESTGFIGVYQFDGKKWSLQGSLIGDPNTAEFGRSVGLSYNGTRVAGGAPTSAYDDSVARTGSVLVFDKQ